MNTEEPSARHFPGGIGDKPEERRHLDLRLDHLAAIEARFGHHWRVRYFPREPGRLTVTPVPSRSFALIALTTSSATFVGGEPVGSGLRTEPALSKSEKG
jgi:hypothetical protein